MCGRYVLHSPPDRIREKFQLGSCPDLLARYNIAPGQNIATIACSRDGRRKLAELHWGLVPAWARDPKMANRMINARAETVAEKPAYRSPLRIRRCLVPANGFYEWKTAADGKQPCFIRPQDQDLFAIAGLWDHWKGKDGTVINSVTLITTAANLEMSSIHERMPVILPESAQADWLDPGLTNVPEILQLLQPDPDLHLCAHPVSRRVNKTSEDDSALLESVNHGTRD